MIKILQVDDDPQILELYRDGLTQQGVQVDTASDGVAAINALRTAKPDIVLLDLMMPKFTGVDVLKFIRSDAGLKNLPVILFSNSYMNKLAAEATDLGVQKALLKISCSPAVVLGIINDILAGRPSSEDPSHLLAIPERSTPVPQPPKRPESTGLPAPTPAPDKTVAAEFKAKARRGLLDGGPATCTTMRSLCQSFAAAPNEAQRSTRLQAFYHKISFITAIAGLAECHHLAQMASALEALLFELINKPAAVSPSVLRTIASSVDFLALLFDYAREVDSESPLQAQVLVVDDDPLSNRLAVSALQRAHLRARSTEDPLVGLQWLKQYRFDLVLLDIEMPGMDGFELCRRLRTLPGYQKTPVMYVTSHSDFEHRTKSILSGGDDLISKPMFPMDLAVKAVAMLLKRQLPSA